MSCEIRGAMKGGQLKLTDDKVIFNQSKSGKKEAIKVVNRFKKSNNQATQIRIRISVVDPFHFDMDADPRIRI